MHFSRFLCVVFTTAVAAQSIVATVYSERNFEGASQAISATDQCIPFDLNIMPPRVKSVRVEPGVRCTTYTDENCEVPNQSLPRTQAYVLLGQVHTEAVSCLQYEV